MTLSPADPTPPAASERRELLLVVQIPCFNEAETLPSVLAGIPRRFEGVARVEVQVIDDGSTDDTVEVARRLGVDHVIRQKGNKGLARSFQAGIDAALARGADIVVNTDGDNQYDGSSIADLIRPIVRGEADIVLGDRRPGENREFSPLKRLLQRFGSRVVRALAEIDVADAVTGFRAYSRDAALAIRVMTRFSYTIETLIHAGQRGFTVRSVPVRTNRTERPSRLFKSIPQFVSRQGVTILRSCVMYRPLGTFMSLGTVLLALGAVPVLRFLWFFAIGEGDGHVQSLVLGGVLLLAGYLTMLIALLSDTIATNRRLTEDLLVNIRDMATAAPAGAERDANEMREAARLLADVAGTEDAVRANGTDAA